MGDFVARTDQLLKVHAAGRTPCRHAIMLPALFLGAAAASAVANYEWFKSAVVLQFQCALKQHPCVSPASAAMVAARPSASVL